MTSEPFLPTAALLEGDVDDGLISRFLRYLDRVMDVVLVVDRLDESLVVLGASLCWPLCHAQCRPQRLADALGRVCTVLPAGRSRRTGAQRLVQAVAHEGVKYCAGDN